jgi:hypothetical protein
LALELRCDVPALLPELGHFLHPFTVADFPHGFSPITGSIHPFELTTVQRHLSPSAVPFAATRDLIELYQEGDRFWLIDDRWGMAELNLLKGQWRSWVLPRPTTDAMRCAEMAILWPLAQLLRARGLHLLPAVSIARDGWAALIICPFSLEPELTALVRRGYRVIGQRWTALREEDGRIAMLHMPGSVERIAAPRLRGGSSGRVTLSSSPGRVDLNAEYLGSHQNHAFCDAVLVTEFGRRPAPQLSELDHTAAMNALRRAWPIVDLTPHRHAHQLTPRIAQHCRCGELQLSRDPQDLLRLLHEFRASRRRASGVPTSPLELKLYINDRRPRSLAG